MKQNLRNTYRPPTPLLSQEEKDEAFKRASEIIAKSDINDYRFTLSPKQLHYSSTFYVDTNMWELIESNKSVDEIVDKAYDKKNSRNDT
jgi:hypothetical protein